MREKTILSRLRVGMVIPVSVAQDHIDDSDPCDKDNCMLSRAFIDLLSQSGLSGPFRVKSTNHGVMWDLGTRRLVGVFDSKTARRIFTYDRVFKKTRSKIKAAATVKPFLARIMIESNQAKPAFPPMSEAAKAALRDRPRKHKEATRAGKARDLSM
jgi:hypothetical protein